MNGIFVDKCRKNFLSSVGRTGARGFSLLEVMVAMVVFMIVIGSVYGLLQVGLIDRNRASRRSDVLKNARAAVHLIGRDVLNAGLGYNKSGAIVPDNFISNHLGLPADADAERDVLTAIVGGDNLFSNILDGAARTDVVAFAYRDVGFNDGNLITLTDVAATSGDPASVTISTPASQARNSRVFDLYLVESQNSQVAVMATAIPTNNRSIVAAPGDPLGLNQPLNGTGENRSVLKKCSTPGENDCMDYTATVAKRFFWVAYRVKADGTLVRIVFGNNSGATAAEQIQEMPIAYNIQDLQVRYVLEDGTVTDNPYLGADNTAGTADDKWENFNLVRQVTITIKVQATEDDEQLKRPETITLNATFSARNLEYAAG
jgi:prepilin-type N-terminal cleavage/methylation domain-containing protein